MVLGPSLGRPVKRPLHDEGLSGDRQAAVPFAAGCCGGVQCWCLLRTGTHIGKVLIKMNDFPEPPNARSMSEFWPPVPQPATKEKAAAADAPAEQPQQQLPSLEAGARPQFFCRPAAVSPPTLPWPASLQACFYALHPLAAYQQPATMACPVWGFRGRTGCNNCYVHAP